MNKNSYKTHTRKLRQLKFLSKKLQKALSANSYSGTLEDLIRKVKRMVMELQQFIAGAELRKAVGAAALVLGFSIGQNTDAQTTFTANVQNPFSLNGASSYFSNPAVADLDNDGDKDFVTGSWYGDFYYFQNNGTSAAPSFAMPVINPFGLAKTADTSYHFVAIADLDNDGDKDLMIGSFMGDLLYYQNTGSATVPAFGAPQMNPFGLTSVYYAAAPAFADYDNDGDQDLIVGEYYGNLQFFQNTGTASAPAFAAPVMNLGGFTATNTFAHPAMADLDGDGDLDLLVGEKNGAVQYYQNTGTASTPAFAPAQANPFGLAAVYKVAMPTFLNIDNDSDWDVMDVDYYGNFNYFQNVTAPLGIHNAQAETSFLTVYPNPTAEFISVKGNGSETVAMIEVIDVKGCLVASQTGNAAMNVKDLAAGVYTVKITDEKGNVEMKQIQKQ